MKNLIKFAITTLMLVFICVCLTGCDGEASSYYSSEMDVAAQERVTDALAASQKTPTDINYSLERYNLIRRAYWVNGQREKANTLICSIEKPLSYVTLFAGNAMVGSFVVDGKVSSLNSFLTPSAVDERTGNSSAGYTTITTEVADVDGSYGENDNGIFFFTVDGNYYEWTGIYLYSDVPFIVDNPVVTYQERVNDE